MMGIDQGNILRTNDLRTSLDIYAIDFLRSRAVEYVQIPVLRMPYIIGGDDFSGMDCSGLIVETLQSVGLVENNKDYTAHGLYLKFKNPKTILEKPRFGALVFWFRNGRAEHVAMLVNDFQVCESAGGGFETKTEEDAKRDNAYVRIRPLDYRGENYKIIDPFKIWDGEKAA